MYLCRRRRPSFQFCSRSHNKVQNRTAQQAEHKGTMLSSYHTSPKHTALHMYVHMYILYMQHRGLHEQITTNDAVYILPNNAHPSLT